MKKEKTTLELYEMFNDGVPLNDRDLATLEDRAFDLMNLCSEFGPVFKLAKDEAMRVYSTCAGFIRERN
jgi:hypothetical protein